MLVCLQVQQSGVPQQPVVSVQRQYPNKMGIEIDVVDHEREGNWMIPTRRGIPPYRLIWLIEFEGMQQDHEDWNHQDIEDTSLPR